MSPPDLADLEAFAAIVRTGSFRRAATERGVSPSALSYAIRNLEERLGMRLLNRTTRSVALTEAGEKLLRRLTPALQEIALAIDDVNSLRESPAGTIKINAPGPAVEHVLLPVLPAFMRAYPEVSVELRRDDALIDIVEAGFDAGVRFGEQLARDMIAVPIGPSLRYRVTATPSYVKSHGRPRHPNDLLAHSCIRHRFPGGSIFAWDFEKAGKSITITPESRITLNDPRHVLRMALEGIGYCRLLSGYVEEMLAEGRLVEVLADWSPPLPSWYLYYPSRRHVPTAMRAFLNFLAGQTWPTRKPA